MIVPKLPSYKNFNKATYPWKPSIDYRKNPESYRVGRGEQGVLICEPYKSEIVSHWRFKTPEIAAKSSQVIYSLFLDYLAKRDFVGADMARKFLQMGFTRAKRYANYAGGKKYASFTYEHLPKGTGEASKLLCSQIFYDKWQLAEKNQVYKQMKEQWKQHFG